MTDETRLDAAHAAMEAAPDDDAARLRFYERLVDAELSLLLAFEETEGQISPQVFALEEGNVVLAFDREDRLAAFADGVADQARLSGRTLVEMLAGQGLGLGLNLGVAPSSILIPAEAVVWLADTLRTEPQAVEARPQELGAPKGLPEALITALDAKLPAAAGLARFAYLASVTYEGGRRGHMLAFVDAHPGAREALAQAAGEALIFSGVEAGEMDVAFFAASDPVSARLARVALRFDLPVSEEAEAPKAPGMDPDAPPKLR
ncbi:MAG: SseB family protein [Rhodobacteraceae bacterium]|nr:SseB family protein [Paracoccaceae bacterium]